MPIASLESDGVGHCTIAAAADGITLVGCRSDGVATCTINPAGMHIASLESDGVAGCTITPAGVITVSLRSDGVATSVIVTIPLIYTDVTLGDAQPIGMAIDFKGVAELRSGPLVLL